MQIVDWLATEGTGTATEFASRLPLTRQAVSRHLVELEAAGLVKGAKKGRERVYRFNPTPLVDAKLWMEERAARWDRSLARLRDFLDES